MIQNGESSPIGEILYRNIDGESIGYGKTDMVELNKLGGGKRTHTLLTTAVLSAPPLNFISILFSKDQRSHLRTSWEGGKRNYTLLTKAKLSAPPLSFISILFSKHHRSE